MTYVSSMKAYEYFKQQKYFSRDTVMEYAKLGLHIYTYILTAIIV